MANDKAKTLEQKEYEKELRRIKQFIKRAEQRGFRFEADIIPDTPKKITKSSVNKLKKITPKKLYSMSTALSDKGDIISGTEKRVEEYKLSAQKGLQTRRQKIEQVSSQSIDFETSRRKQDKVEKDRLVKDEQFKHRFSEGELAYATILDMINMVDRTHRKASEHLRSVLNAEIKTYGKELVLMSIGNTPQEAIELADISLRYNPGDSRHDGAISELLRIITGTIPTIEEMKNLQDVIDNDDYTDMEE